MGDYDLGGGLGRKKFTDDTMRFHKNGETNFPRRAHGIWFLSQYERFGLLSDAPDPAAVADKLILSDLYREAAVEMKVSVPDDDMKPFTLKLDDATFDPNKPAA
jgi:nitrate/nitrite transport system substrate-binding protein